MSVPRSTVEELFVRYNLEPKIKDIFVEGDTDCRVLRWFLKEMRIDDAQAYCIERVTAEVSEGGNRQRLIQTATELDRLSRELGNNVVFIIDADAGYVEEEIIETRYILKTDFACMESYFANSYYLRRLGDLFFGRDVIDRDEDLDKILSFCRKIFAIRFCAHNIARARVIFTKKDTCFVGGTLHVNVENIVVKTVQQNKKLDLDALNECVKRRLDTWSVDARYTMNGHDFVYLVSVIASGKGVDRKLTEVEVIQRALVNSINIDDFQEYQLFKEISNRFSA